MSKKQKLQAIVTKLKSWSESSGDETLDNHIKELEDEINAITETQDEEEDEGGNSPDTPPDLP